MSLPNEVTGDGFRRGLFSGAQRYQGPCVVRTENVPAFWFQSDLTGDFSVLKLDRDERVLN